MQINDTNDTAEKKKPPQDTAKKELERTKDLFHALTALVPPPAHDVDEKEENENDAKDDRHDDRRNDQQRLVAQRRPFRYHCKRRWRRRIRVEVENDKQKRMRSD